MPQRVKTTYRKIKIETKESPEKENEINGIIPSRLRTLRERNKPVNFQYNDSISLSDDERMQNENLIKPLSFWSKKLKDLESKRNITKERKYEMYEFNESDDSFSPKKKRKKCSKKCGVTKKKQYDFECNFKKNFFKKKKLEAEEVCNKNLAEENLILTKKKNELDKKKQKLPYSSILTSTPATNKTNFIDASNFLFLSPLLKVDDFQDQQSTVNYKTPAKNNIMRAKTVKQQNNLIKPHCTRVLRSRKIVD